MNNRHTIALLPLCLLCVLSGCGPVGAKTGSLALIYGVTASIATLVLLSYIVLQRKKDPWYLMLLICVCVVDTGYFALSVSQTLAQALMANRLAYLGSVFLPLSILMIILRTSDLCYPKWLPGCLIALDLMIFLLPASGGILDIYYQEVWIESIGGTTVLQKTYGPLHIVYLFFLLIYFSAMVGSIIYVISRKKLDSVSHMTVLAMAALLNIGVWFMEQLVHTDFELLAVSYIISELFLLSLDMMIRQSISALPQPPVPVAGPTVTGTQEDSQELFRYFQTQLTTLTHTERLVYDLLAEGRSTRDILEQLGTKENTLKYHNKNIFSKLGVSSRKELRHIASQLPKE